MGNLPFSAEAVAVPTHHSPGSPPKFYRSSVISSMISFSPIRMVRSFDRASASSVRQSIGRFSEVRGNDPSSGPRRLVRTPVAGHLLPSEKMGAIGRARAAATTIQQPVSIEGIPTFNLCRTSH